MSWGLPWRGARTVARGRPVSALRKRSSNVMPCVSVGFQRRCAALGKQDLPLWELFNKGICSLSISGPFQDLALHHCWTDYAYWGKSSASSLSLTIDSLEPNTYVSLNTKRARPGLRCTTCCLLSAWRKGANRCRITVQLRETKVHHKINKQPVLQLPQMYHVVPRVCSAL